MTNLQGDARQNTVIEKDRLDTQSDQASQEARLDASTRDKADLRKQMIRRRAVLSQAMLTAAADALAVRALAALDLLTRNHVVPSQGSRNLAVYAAMRGEIDPRPTVDRLRQLGWQVWYPRVTDGGLRFAPWPCSKAWEDFLSPGGFGVPEPSCVSLAEPENGFDLIFLPALAMDQSGNRLGWGKGYYDGFLRSLNRRQPRLALIHDFQLVGQELPHGPRDVPIDGAITELRTHWSPEGGYAKIVGKDGC